MKHRRRMARAFGFAVLLSYVFSTALFPAGAHVHVRGYYRKDGTYVQPHERKTAGAAEGSSGTKSYFRQDIYSSVPRDSHGRIARSKAARHQFQHGHPCPATSKTSGACAGYVVDHVNPLECGGADSPTNMQWQTVVEAKAKDKTEMNCRR